MGWATAEDTCVRTSRPKKGQSAAMMMAGVGFMQGVGTTVAMALGASVAPLTMMTPMALGIMGERMILAWPEPPARGGAGGPGG